MSVTADARPADLFTLEIFRPLEIRSSDDAVRQDIFVATNKDEVGGSLGEGPHQADGPRQSDLRFSGEQCRSHHAGRGNIDKLEIEIMLAKQPGFLGEIGQALRHNHARVDAGHLLSRRADSNNAKSAESKRSAEKFNIEIRLHGGPPYLRLRSRV